MAPHLMRAQGAYTSTFITLLLCIGCLHHQHQDPSTPSLPLGVRCDCQVRLNRDRKRSIGTSDKSRAVRCVLLWHRRPTNQIVVLPVWARIIGRYSRFRQTSWNKSVLVDKYLHDECCLTCNYFGIVENERGFLCALRSSSSRGFSLLLISVLTPLHPQPPPPTTTTTFTPRTSFFFSLGHKMYPFLY